MRRKPFVRSAVLGVLTLGLLLAAQAADVYVSSSGNDGNDGLSAGTAKATLAAAVGVLNGQPAGSTLHVLSNLTENAVIGVTANGAAGNPIVLRSDPVGTPFTLTGVVLEVTGTYVTIQSLNFDGQGIREGSIIIKGVASNCTVQDCQFTGVAANAVEQYAPENLSAPIQVLGTDNVTVTGCSFNPTANLDLVVLLSSSAGPGSNFTMSNCVVNSNGFAGGVKAFRAWDNIQILNTQFLDMRIYSFELQTNTSAIDNTTSDNILIQDCVVRGYIATDSNLGAVRIFNSKASNFRVIRTAFSNLGTGGVDAISLYSNSSANPNPTVVDTVLIDGVNMQKDPTSTNAFQDMVAVRNSSTTAGAQRPLIQNLTIQNCVATTACTVQFEYVECHNVTIRDCTFTNELRQNATAIRTQDGSIIRGMLVERVSVENRGGDDAVSFFGTRFSGAARTQGHNVEIRDCSFTCRPTSQTDTGSEGIAFKDDISTNVRVYNTRIDANVAFNVSRAGGGIDGLIIDGCFLYGGTPTSTSYLMAGFLVREDGTAPGATLRNATVTNSVINGVSALCMANSSNPMVIENVSFANCIFNGTRQGSTIAALNNLNNVSFTNCSFTGGVVGGFAVYPAVAAVCNLRDLAFTDCQFACTSAIDDTTTLRPAAFLVETANSRVTYATLTNCTFTGGNHGLSIARNNIPAGPGDEPIVNGLLVQDCTMSNSFTRGLNVAFADGGDLTFRRISVSNVGGVGVNLQFYGDNVTLEDIGVAGGGVAQAMVLETKGGDAAQNWAVRNGSFGALSGGVVVTGPVRNSVLQNLSVTGAGIHIDNSGAGGPADAAQGIDVLDCHVTGAPGTGIRVEGSDHRVIGCTVENAGGAGISVREVNLLLPANQNVTVTTNTVFDCVGAALILEGKNSTVGWNTTYRNGAGLLVRSGASGTLGGISNTTGNTITRNALFGGLPGSATGIFEDAPAYFGDPGPSGNTYVNNTVTDWAAGSDFLGSGNTIQNNIFAFNVGSGLKVRPSGLSGLVAGWNCAAENLGVDFDGIGIDYTKDIWYDPDFVSRDPASANFYLLSPTSGCRDRGTPVGLKIDLGARESGDSEVASWRLY
ncbi:right-handed parallel beta-helix repeat-containing protein [bacterium]|nr:right-handed parallel beta-helix repeat-containing protein [bacterium]